MGTILSIHSARIKAAFQLLALLGFAGGLAQPCTGAEFANDVIARASAAIQAATPRAQSDPAHPVFHVTSPAQWINDPNGPVYYRGYYHLFYQLNPFSDGSGPKYWGHVRSHDLAKWEPLPVALWPSGDLGETEVWSGCCTINGQGQPMAFYTSIAAGKSPQTDATQWAAIGDKDLITWSKSPANPVLTESLHGGKKIYDWRDPFIFKHQRRTFMVTGGNLNEAKGGQATVNIYEAQNPGLTQWIYRGVLFKLPDPETRTAECPNFFELDGHWVLLVSPYGKVQYFVGDFDAEQCRFRPASRGLLDVGPGFYAPDTMQLADGRRLVWGWVNGFPGGRGWNGCLSLPRQLSLSSEGQLRQSPVPQLTKLRGNEVAWRNVPLENEGRTFALPGTNTLEIRAEIDLKSAKNVVLEFKDGFGNIQPESLKLSDTELMMGGDHGTFSRAATGRKLNVRIFLDRSVMEVFVNDQVCATRVISPLDNRASLQIRPEGGNAQLNRLQCWAMKTIW